MKAQAGQTSMAVAAMEKRPASTEGKMGDFGAQEAQEGRNWLGKIQKGDFQRGSTPPLGGAKGQYKSGVVNPIQAQCRTQFQIVEEKKQEEGNPPPPFATFLPPREEEPRPRKKAKGKELQDLIESYKQIQSMTGKRAMAQDSSLENLEKQIFKEKEAEEETKLSPQQQDKANMSQRGVREPIIFQERQKRAKRTQQSPSKFQNMDHQMSTEEERMIKQALKNSVIEQQTNQDMLDELEEMKTFYPTPEEFASPIEYIEKLTKQGAAQYGCIKIVPPADFRPPLEFDMEQKTKMPTRLQVLQDLSQGKPFEQNYEGHIFKDYMTESMKKDKDMTAEDLRQLEKEYWRYVDTNSGERIQVEYAADLSVTQYGSGFGREGQKVIHQESLKYRDHPWNLNNMFKQPLSMMQFPRSKDISGINIPWLYIGQKFSTFCWHFEDLMLYSINYSHWGKPKLWYAVPESHRERFDKAAKNKISLLFKKDPNILLDIITMISPAYLASQKVKIYKTLQKPGEFVLTFPGSYHAGFSTGFNIGEAVNFVSKSWIDYGFKCQDIYRKSREKIPVFPMDWLVIENIRNTGRQMLDNESQNRLQKAYQRLMKDERKHRRRVEQLMHESEHQKKRLMIKMLQNRENVAEDAFQCYYCTDFCYMSMVRCLFHKIQYCLYHDFMCGCELDNLIVEYRYSNAELEEMERTIERACHHGGEGEEEEMKSMELFKKPGGGKKAAPKKEEQEKGESMIKKRHRKGKGV